MPSSTRLHEPERGGQVLQFREQGRAMCREKVSLLMCGIMIGELALHVETQKGPLTHDAALHIGLLCKC